MPGLLAFGVWPARSKVREMARSLCFRTRLAGGGAAAATHSLIFRSSWARFAANATNSRRTSLIRGITNSRRTSLIRGEHCFTKSRFKITKSRFKKTKLRFKNIELFFKILNRVSKILNYFSKILNRVSVLLISGF